ncbi:RagB/SusD family nutrient uptake outer membrane protein [Pseudobacter ginsenosidimutans]|uniref:SusD-like starch-binding protein associating with outer membrane n=1 Tax=Pseudobacter ginsenosidimutans TaxID=661488 RepID=A0A4Q7N074_9BACT|nr:RagB/SusD family nutrient uptake outer membrane protein [Pseudobacter ginsenosidimutans]QEC43575.1 RagB/SusD family nutrient uptake outer membrane protein [Pseudobacter ginsenosidimutans]RZS74970.1 SusD-like starch-binding protein associating with outer membrane [Pseudobacter ginsenosidimutans]
MKPLLLILAGSLMITSCKKFLDEKPDPTLSTVNTLDDVQELLDNFRKYFGGEMALTACDDYYLTEAEWQARQEKDRNIYLWHPTQTSYYEWNGAYDQLLHFNTALTNAEKAKTGRIVKNRDHLRGACLTIRSEIFLRLAQQFAIQYNSTDAGTEPGIVLRFSEDYNEKIVRSDLKTTYGQIVKDLESAIPLLPAQSLYKHRPTKASAWGLLARTCLQMANYPKAREAADASLKEHHQLLNYNTCNAAEEYPLSRFETNPEILLYRVNENGIAAPFVMPRVDTNLLLLYKENDLRKEMYFSPTSDGADFYRGTYAIGGMNFTGLTVSEVYLIRAECAARAGDTQAALDDINTLLQARYKAGHFVPETAANAAAALELVLTERRKEMLLRGQRWGDIKRLNREPGRAITLTRKIGTNTYTIPPNDPRYAFLIPPEVMMFKPDIPQNPR